MKKVLLSLTLLMVFLVGCKSSEDRQSVIKDQKAAEAYYSDWDRAVRADVDIQNMFVSTPRKIEKPIDMYMAMALAVKYNYSRRMVSYEQAIVDAGKVPVNRLPEVLSKAGYVNTDSMGAINSDLKATWNILDLSTVYYQTTNKNYQSAIAYEQSRKVIHNILQETRSLYWKALMSQRLLPVMDEMIEFMTLEVDEMNIVAKEYAKMGKDVPLEDLKKRRTYMEDIKKLSTLKRDVETAEVRLASFMGFHPSTEFKLVGKEYGNFALPEMKTDLSGLEWLALTNRPEIRVHDSFVKKEDLKIVVKEFQNPDEKQYENDPRYYNRLWAKKGKEVGLSVFEDIKRPNRQDLETLRRQRMSTLVLSQVYVSWARYESAVEDYQINMEIAGLSEDIAEDTTYAKGYQDMKSHLESARAIEDEAKAYRAYIEVQDSLGNLYSTVGLDALPYYMINEKLSKIAFQLRETLEKWRKGEFVPDNRPYLLNIPSKRPPINLSSAALIPDITTESGKRIDFTIPRSIFAKMDFRGKVTSKAGLVDDKPLPSWLKYDESTFTFSGVAMPSEIGTYPIKVYFADQYSNVGYLTFKINVIDVYVPSVRVQGLTEGSKATVLKRCVGSQCKDDYIEATVVGTEVEIR
ncbi:MAG: putative Ig domain-containing protein [Alphaproteobacteria bacterium]|nr:putative Ig domain-containing protein [Alphaproteobacteria bacterium]